MEIADSFDFDDASPQSAAEWIENQILSGRLAPGTRVELRMLSARYQMAASEWTEALARLSLAGLAVPAGDQALRVAPVSLADLEDLTSTRILIEGAALRAAIGAGNAAWEDGIRTAYAQLAELDPLLAQGAPPPGWEDANRIFHQALTAACPARRLLHFAGQLYLQHERYRRLSTARPHSLRDVAGEHRALHEAALARDADRAERLLADHIQRTATIAAEGIRDGSWFGQSGDHSRPLR
ncbi:MAG: FCD domain-containing protein [Magnetospirillum sp.]|nr:FCD domain-containing protein [Magnetospirillum sp.]